MKLRLAKPSALVDVNGIGGLDGLREDGGALVVGAVVRQQSLLDHEAAARIAPLVGEATRYVGNRTTRHRGTVGGSLAYAAPWAELPGVCVALDATIEVRSARGTRAIAARDFFRDAHATALEPDELLTSVRLPGLPERTGTAWHEVSTRYRDYAQVGAGAVVSLDAAGGCTAAELVLVRVQGAPYRADVSSLVGSRVEEEALDAALAGLEGLQPPDDVEASSGYRRRVAGVLARRALRDAAERAAGGTA
jgi:carbon-monoxide dehydrogenase medium subunit